MKYTHGKWIYALICLMNDCLRRLEYILIFVKHRYSNFSSTDNNVYHIVVQIEINNDIVFKVVWS